MKIKESSLLNNILDFSYLILVTALVQCLIYSGKTEYRSQLNVHPDSAPPTGRFAHEYRKFARTPLVLHGGLIDGLYPLWV